MAKALSKLGYRIEDAWEELVKDASAKTLTSGGFWLGCRPMRAVWPAPDSPIF